MEDEWPFWNLGLRTQGEMGLTELFERGNGVLGIKSNNKRNRFLDGKFGD